MANNLNLLLMIYGRFNSFFFQKNVLKIDIPCYFKVDTEKDVVLLTICHEDYFIFIN